MKQERDLREEQEKIMKKLLDISRTEGVKSLRFIHLAIASCLIQWVLTGEDQFNPLFLDETLYKKQTNVPKESSLKEFMDFLSEHSKDIESIKVKKLDVDGNSDLGKKIREIIGDRKVDAFEFGENKEDREDSFYDIISEVEENRKLKKERPQTDITKTKEFKALSSKLNIKFTNN
jgi:hypothetical protein